MSYRILTGAERDDGPAPGEGAPMVDPPDELPLYVCECGRMGVTRDGTRCGMDKRCKMDSRCPTVLLWYARITEAPE